MCTMHVSFTLAAPSLGFSDTVIYVQLPRCAYMQHTHHQESVNGEKHVLVKMRVNLEEKSNENERR